jgi:hypothetical protein
MIKVKHPDPECNRNQEEMVNSAPENRKRFHELLFTHGNICYHYHNEAKRFNPTEADYREWLDGLPASIRKDMEKDGFEKCRTYLSFIRYVNEKNDIGIDEYIRLHMDPDDYLEYMAMLNKKDGA